MTNRNTNAAWLAGLKAAGGVAFVAVWAIVIWGLALTAWHNITH